MPTTPRLKAALLSTALSTVLGAAAAILSATGADAAALKIGMTFQELNNPYFVTMQKALRDAAATIGATVVVTDAHHDVAKQISDVEDMLQQKIDILLVNPTDTAGIQSAVTSAKNAGVVVVAVDANASGPVDSFVGSKNYDAGLMACEYLAKSIGGSGEVVILDGIPVVPILERVRGCKAALEKAPGVKLVDTQNGKQERDTALTTTENMIQRHPNLKGVFSVNDGGAMGALSAIEASGQGHQADLGGRGAGSDHGDAGQGLEVRRDLGAISGRPGADRARHRAGEEVGRQRAEGGADRRQAGRRRGRENLPLVGRTWTARVPHPSCSSRASRKASPECGRCPASTLPSRTARFTLCWGKTGRANPR